MSAIAVFGLFLLGGIIWLCIFALIPEKLMLCKDCGHVANPKLQAGELPFSPDWIGIMLWILLLVPWIIYTVWRHVKDGNRCERCSAKALVPYDPSVSQK